MMKTFHAILILAASGLVTNVSAAQPTQNVVVASVTASDFEDPNVPENTLDQDLSTRWSAEGNGQWIKYNLGAPQMVNEVHIAWHRGDKRQTDFDLEVSLDAANWTEVFSGSSGGSTLGLERYGFDDVRARYVRIVGHGNTENDWNSITEVEIHRPVDDDTRRLLEILVADFVRLGDNQPLWEATVRIKQGELRHSRYAAVEFVAVGVWEGTSSNLIVNGREYVLPISEPLWFSDIPLRGKTVIPIPVGVLRSGDNTIRIESGPINDPRNRYDDFFVANIVLVLSR